MRVLVFDWLTESSNENLNIVVPLHFPNAFFFNSNLRQTSYLIHSPISFPAVPSVSPKLALHVTTLLPQLSNT